MTKTVIAIYDDFQIANDAVRALVKNGIPRDNISIVANNARTELGTMATSTAAEDAGKAADETGAGAGVGAGIGATIGGVGGLLVSLGALIIPGIGPVVAAGPLAVALSTLTGAGVGAVAGGVTGGLLGALIGLGVPEEEAEYYAEGIRRGGALVTVQTGDSGTDSVIDLLNHYHPVDINERVAQWREQGWERFDPGSPPVSEGESIAEHQIYARTEYDQASGDFDIENPVYHNHYSTYLADTGYPYDYYTPGYRYGYDLSHHPDYRDRTWDTIEMDAQRDWEREHPGTWERFKASIRHAWEDVTGQR